MAISKEVADVLRGYKAAIQKQSNRIAAMYRMVNDLQSRPRSVAEEIDAIEGRRMEGTLSGEIEFTADDLGQRSAPITMIVSQDGPFVQTHYPMAIWRPSAPDNATNLGRWRPVSTFPLPDQVVDSDIIDLMYEMQDGGNQRLLQNEARGPLLSRPDNICPTPVPTLWSPGSTVLFIPTYLALTWDAAEPPTAGILHVDIPGYRIVNL
jgi:hypothetical protein